MKQILVCVCILVVSVVPRASYAEGTRLFALLVGVNRSVDGQPPLRYADDDAIRYQELFVQLGAKPYLVTRLDANTQRLYPKTTAIEPTREGLSRAVGTLVREVAESKKNGFQTIVYVAYAGHGLLKDGRGYVTLEDDRLSGDDLAEQVVSRIGADRTHLLVDACESFFLAYSRGPGGERRALPAWNNFTKLVANKSVGLLLSTSAALESHEWEGFQAGVFSHEVRSGLYGAADANHDGAITYRELAAFVSRAHAAIANEKYRPDVFSRSPESSDAFAQLPAGTGRLGFSGVPPARYYVEDTRGIRYLDLYATGDMTTLRPAPGSHLYVRRHTDDLEYRIHADAADANVAQLPEQPASARTRGAANDAFDRLFELPFHQRDVDAYIPPKPETWTRPPTNSARKTAAIATIGVGVAAGLVGSVLFWRANALQDSLSDASSQRDATRVNQRVSDLNQAGMWSLIGGGIAAGVGTTLLLWPHD